MADELTTDGEKFYLYIKSQNQDVFDWSRFELMHNYTGRASQYIELFSEIVAVNLVCRLVSVGRSIHDRFHIFDPEFDYEFKKYLRDYLSLQATQFDQFYRFCKSAVRASIGGINATVRRNLTAWSQRTHDFCYMCGVRLDYSSDLPYNAFTLEHLWPQSYGGNSIEENLLPACRACNSKKKKDFATWAMPAIQSMIYGLEDSEEKLDEIDGSYKYALHYKFVQDYSRQKKISLRRGFQEIGPWRKPQKIDSSDVADFFNLKII